MIDAAVYEAPAAGQEYQLDERDLLWLGRSLAGECYGDATAMGCAAVAWTMLRRYLLWGGERHWKRFSGFIQDFSQPVDPEWADPGSQACSRAPSACTPERIERRRRYRSTDWADLPELPQHVAWRFARGELPDPVPGAVDFAAASRTRRLGLEGQDIDGNVFLGPAEASGRWLDGPVKVRPTMRDRLLVASFAGVSMLSAAAFGLVWWKVANGR